MKSWLLCVLLFFSLCSAQAQVQGKVETSALVLGETVSWESEILDEKRTLNIYLPASYHPDSTQTFPVIYLLDGSVDEDFIHISGLVQFGSFSWINLLPESIVVGISNVDRKSDFTWPTSNQDDKALYPTTGGSADFIQYLAEEVQPYVKKNYLASEECSIIGQSLGGLLATEILYKQPDLFDRYFIVSPSLWWDDESLLDVKPNDFGNVKSIYVAVGKEGEIMERVASELHTTLGKCKSENTSLYYAFFEKHDHGDVLHEAIYRGFEMVYEKDK